MVDFGLPTGPYSAVCLFFCFFFPKSRLLSLMLALGEQDFSTLPILIFPTQVVKLMIQAVKNLQNLYRNFNCALLANNLQLVSLL